MSNPSIINLTEKNFKQEVIESSLPVLVDFWAEWCNPCKMVAPIIDDLAGEYDGKIKFGKVNVEESQQLASEYGIRGIPTILLFKDGQITDQIVGLRSKRDFKSMLDQVTP
jgi:thioredoxin 1